MPQPDSPVLLRLPPERRHPGTPRPAGAGSRKTTAYAPLETAAAGTPPAGGRTCGATDAARSAWLVQEPWSALRPCLPASLEPGLVTSLSATPAPPIGEARNRNDRRAWYARPLNEDDGESPPWASSAAGRLD